MKAPDKIYVAKTTFPKYIDWDGSPINTKRVSNNDVCYIRKDLLLEWAKELTSEPYDRTTESARKHQIAHYLLEEYNSL